MREFVTRQKEEKLLSKLICDRCGNEEIILQLDTSYLIEFDHHFGFGSKYDMEKIEFDICETCLFEVLKKENIKYRLEGNKSAGPVYEE